MSWDRFKEINYVHKIYSECSVKNLSHHIPQAKSFIDTPSSMLLVGECGTGKTYFMFTLIRELLEHRKLPLHAVVFIKAKNLSDKMEEAFKQYGTTKAEVEKMVDADILFIDDFGVQSRAERMERDFYEICDIRLADMRPTVFSTNLEEGEIKEVFGARIYSRLKVCQKISFNGQDQRSYF